MNKNEKKVYDLVELLKGYREEYYNRSEPSITDAEYDALFDELTELERITGIYLPDSPTQCVGFEVIDNCDTVKHSFPVLSMAKTKSYDRVVEFVNKREVIFSHKVDGITIVLEYDEGQLVSAATRGDGLIGKNILLSVNGIKSIPHVIDCKSKLAVIGEGFITIHNYQNRRKTRLDTSGKEYIDARNFASNIIQSNNPIENQECLIDFLAFSLHVENGCGVTKENQLSQLRLLGFEVCEHVLMKKDYSKESIIDCIEALREKADEKSIPVDGIVITFNDVEYSKSLGRTTHHYNDSLAFKF